MDSTLLRRIGLVAVLLMVWSVALGLRSGSAGNEPVQRPGWAKGMAEVANLETRVAYWDGPLGGQFQFLYRGDQEEFQKALDLFAKIEAPQRLLVVVQGPGSGSVPGEQGPSPVDWELNVTDRQGAEVVVQGKLPPAWEAARRRLNDAPPTLRVYVAAEGADGFAFEKVKVPDGVTVQDTRATAHGYAMADASVIRGKVTEIGSKPLAGVDVALERRKGNELAIAASTKTDDEGRFEIKRLAPGTYDLRASTKGYASRWAGHAQLGLNAFEEFAIQLAPVAELSGVAVDGDGKPVSGLTVRVDQVLGPDGEGYAPAEAGPVKTDEAGRFVFDNLPAGSVQLYAFDESHLIDNSLERHKVPAKDVSLKVVKTGQVKGKVLSKAQGQQSVHIAPEGGEKIGSWGGSMYVQPDGAFAFKGVPPGKYEVWVDGSERKPVEVKGGEVAEVMFGGNR